MNNEETQENLEEVDETLKQTHDDVEEAEDELVTLQKELDTFKEKYARVHADFDNIKKRLEKEKYQALEYANEKFSKDLIPVLDALYGAIASADGEGDKAELFDKLHEGVELTLKQFLSVLEKHGVTEVKEDEPFDANVHNAVQQVDSDEHESGEIVQTYQKGYRYKERTLRDAMVVIAN